MRSAGCSLPGGAAEQSPTLRQGAERSAAASGRAFDVARSVDVSEGDHVVKMDYVLPPARRLVPNLISNPRFDERLPMHGSSECGSCSCEDARSLRKRLEAADVFDVDQARRAPGFFQRVLEAWSVAVVVVDGGGLVGYHTRVPLTSSGRSIRTSSASDSETCLSLIPAQ